MIIYEDKLKQVIPSELKDINKKQYDWLSSMYNFSYLKKFYKCLDGEIKHVKKYYCLSNYFINELIGKLIREYFGDLYIKTEVIREYNTGIYSLVSDNFLKEGFRYTVLNDERFNVLNMEKFNNRIISIDRIDELNFKKNDLVKLKGDLKRMIISDFISNCYDRAFRNFMVGFNRDKIKLMPMYDFEFSFKEGDKDYPNVFAFDFKNFDDLDYIRKDEVFQKYLNMAIDLDMNDIIEKFHDIHPIKLDEYEIKKYKFIVLNKQDEIRKRRLIK